MKKFVVILLSCLVAVLSAAQDVTPADLEGDWLGTLDAGSIKLRVAFHLKQTPSGLAGTMDSLDQGVKLPIRSVNLAGAKVGIELAMGKFEGTFDRAADSIAGNWMQGPATLPLVLKRVKDPAALETHRQQEPKKPYPYREEEVSYENKKAGITLAGTLTIPQGTGPFPTALLITGSGAQDRDETIMGHKPFLVLADHLTRKGIAVLRVDDRGVGKSGGNPATSTTADFATDVEAGIAFLKTRKEVDGKRIGLIGHSEGGVIAPLVAARNPEVAFIVLMAGSGVSGDQVILSQTVDLNRAGGVTGEALANAESEEREFLTLLKNEPDNAKLEKKLRELWAGKMPEGRIEITLKTVLSPWYRNFIAYDPTPALNKVKCPVLAINGERDLQVSAKQNLPSIRKALTAGGNKNVETIEFPGLNHLFQTAKTGLVAEYSQIEETISPAVLETISSWVAKQTAPKATAK